MFSKIKSVFVQFTLSNNENNDEDNSLNIIDATEMDSENRILTKIQPFFKQTLPSQDIMKVLIDYSIELKTSWFDLQDTFHWVFNRKLYDELTIFKHLYDCLRQEQFNSIFALNEFSEEDKLVLFNAWLKAREQGQIEENHFLLVYCFFELAHKWDKTISTKIQKMITDDDKNLKEDDNKEEEDFQYYYRKPQKNKIWMKENAPSAFDTIKFRFLHHQGTKDRGHFLSFCSRSSLNRNYFNYSGLSFFDLHIECNSTNANFKNAHLEKIYFSSADCKGSDFRNVTMKDCEFGGADFRYARIDTNLKMQIVHYIQEYPLKKTSFFEIDDYPFTPLMKYLKQQVPEKKSEATAEWVRKNPFIIKQIIYLLPIMDSIDHDKVTTNWFRLREAFVPNKKLIAAFKTTIKNVENFEKRRTHFEKKV